LADFPVLPCPCDLAIPGFGEAKPSRNQANGNNDSTNQAA
jgi:hypothetical protein